ncbi:hypothetical protein WM45_06875 [Citrobacter sp. AATXR]|jgi:hypothetical protein|nr:hypothetical protein WM45_06875 [Citrobacter sp. AATXR]
MLAYELLVFLQAIHSKLREFISLMLQSILLTSILQTQRGSPLALSVKVHKDSNNCDVIRTDNKYEEPLNDLFN